MERFIQTLWSWDQNAGLFPTDAKAQTIHKDSSLPPTLPHPTCRQRATIHKADRLTQLAVHLRHRRIEAEALPDAHGQVGHLPQILPAGNKQGFSGMGSNRVPQRGGPAPSPPLHHLRTPESESQGAPSVLDTGWPLRPRDFSCAFLHPCLIFTARRRSLLHSRAPGVGRGGVAHRTIKDKVTPVSRSSEKPHEGQIFRFCLTSPVELEWKGLRADMYWSNEIRNA